MDGRPIEHEICGNCKKEIPQPNYVMHTAHCARNITLCQVCKEPFPRSQFDEHKKTCVAVKPKKKQQQPPPEPTTLERSQYYQDRKSVEDKKIAARRERQMQKYDKLVDTGYSLKSSKSTLTNGSVEGESKTKQPQPQQQQRQQQQKKDAAKLLACKFCDLELPKLELEEHENYCGTRTDKCLECGELVMYKYKQIHMDSNHGFLKLKDEPGPRASWDSSTERRNSETSTQRPRPAPFRPFTTLDTTLYSFPSTYSAPPSTPKEKGESYKEISRRLDCPAPQPPQRRRNPPTELTIPCEFCHVPIPHDDLIQHETGCRPDLARYNPRRKASSPEPEDFFMAPQPSSPEVELPCEFCADMIPASQLLRHQATCI